MLCLQSPAHRWLVWPRKSVELCAYLPLPMRLPKESLSNASFVVSSCPGSGTGGIGSVSPISSFRSPEAPWLTVSRFHVFKDLKPYICTFPLCTNELPTFSTRKLWADDEFTEHRDTVKWKCAKCSTEIPTSLDLIEHVHMSHDIGYSELNPVSILATCKGIGKMNFKLEKCPFCLESPGSTRESFISHICRHMESIALSTLPRDVDSDSDEESDKPSESSSSLKLPGKKLSENGHDDVINCLCGNRDGDGATILCERCNTWQHIGCYYASPVDVPGVHLCRPCDSRVFDVLRAKERQRKKLEEDSTHRKAVYCTAECCGPGGCLKEFVSIGSLQYV